MNISGYPTQPSGHSSPHAGCGPSPGCRVNKGLLLNHSLRKDTAKIYAFVKLYNNYEEYCFLLKT